jgi:hypothetical protein
MAHPSFAGKVIDRALADGGTIPVGEHRLKVHHSSARLNERQHRLCKVARSFLGQIVTNPRNHSSFISPRKESIVVLRAA